LYFSAAANRDVARETYVLSSTVPPRLLRRPWITWWIACTSACVASLARRGNTTQCTSTRAGGRAADGKRARDANGCGRRQSERGQHAGNCRSCARSVSRRRAKNEEGANGPVEHVREVRVQAAGGRTGPACASCAPDICLYAVRLSARAPHEGCQAHVLAPSQAHALAASGASCAIAMTASSPGSWAETKEDTRRREDKCAVRMLAR
jgi:hypothetical protein